MESLTNVDVDPPLLEQQYTATPSVNVTNSFAGDVTTIITTINGGGGGHANGPNVTLSGGSTGYDFVGAGSSLVFTVVNAVTVRASISAAKSGSNADITDFTGLTGNTGFGADTGVADKTSHVTYPSTTASALYTQAEVQGLMDKMKEVTEELKAIKDALLAWGGLET